jgi:hypothetical protein
MGKPRIPAAVIAASVTCANPARNALFPMMRVGRNQKGAPLGRALESAGMR